MSIEIFKYPKFQKRVYFIFLIIFMLAAALVVFLGIIGLILGDGNLSEKLSTLLAVIFGSSFMMMGIVTVNIATPDIIVRNDGFQISTLFFQSPWLKWAEIQFIKELSISNNRHKIEGFRVDRINFLYRLVGLTQGLGGKAFLVTEKIDKYTTLMEIVNENRPELFD